MGPMGATSGGHCRYTVQMKLAAQYNYAGWEVMTGQGNKNFKKVGKGQRERVLKSVPKEIPQSRVTTYVIALML